MKQRLFGTDGIRGIANQYPITPELMVNMGRAVTRMLRSDNGPIRILIGRDTRISGDMIECAVASGICSANGEVSLAGVLPTPAVAHLTVVGGFDAGMMISASHNPYHDNGVKIFNSKGFKLSDEQEDDIEALLADNHTAETNRSGPPDDIGPVIRMTEPDRAYATFLRQTLPKDFSLKGLKVVLDCSNGATHQVAPRLFVELGAEVATLFADPDGRNINANCGSQHTKTLQEKVIEQGADIGFAFDGDGDRLIAVDENGDKTTGDQILAVCAQYLKENGRLENNLVVSTVMSNAGLHQALKQLDIRHMIAEVGDRYVLEKMRSHGSILGGEDSGHLIFLDVHTSGDGILSALRLLQIMREKQRSLSELVKIMTVYPQVLMNVAVIRKADLSSIPEIADAIEAVQSRLKDRGRVLVRYSGTRPLCRVMVEGPDADEIKRYCMELIYVIENNLK